MQNHPISNNTSGYESRADLEIGPGNVLYTVWEERRSGSQDIYSAKSADGGQTWSNETRVNDASLALQYAPRLAVDAGGNLYALWADRRSVVGVDLYFSRSTDGGLTWSTNVRVNDIPGSVEDATGDETPVFDIAVHSDKVYIVWSSHNDFDAFVYFDYSSDGGQTWHVDKNIRNSVADFTYSVSLAVDANGVIYAVWMDGRNSSDEELYFARSENNGASWTTDKQLIPANGDTQIWPELLAWGSGQLCLVWGDMGVNDLIYSIRSTNKGDAWSSRLRITGDIERQQIIDAAQDGTGKVYTVWEDDRGSGHNIYWGLSTNGCQSWTDKGKLNATEGDPWMNNSWPNIEVATDGSLHVLWTRENHRIYSSRSDNGGLLWLENQLSSQSPASTQQAPAVAVEPDGSRAYALYQNVSPAGARELYLTYSTDQWVTPGSEYPVTDNNGAGNPSTPVLALGNSCSLHAAWRDQRDGNQNIYYARSVDCGETWSTNLKLNTDATTQIQQNPAIAADENNLCVAWEDRRSGQYDIFVRCSSDGGQTWGSDQNVIVGGGSYNQTNPTISLQGSQVFVSWEDLRTGSSHIYFTHSADLGATWSANLPVDSSPGAVYQPSLDVDSNGKICLAWEDRRRPTDYDIYATCSTDNGQTWPGEVNVIQETANFQQTNPTLRYDATGRWQLTWEDDRNASFLGDVYHASSLDGSGWWMDNLRVIDELSQVVQVSPALAVDDQGRGYLVWQDPRLGQDSIYAAVIPPGTNQPPPPVPPTPTPFPPGSPPPDDPAFGPNRPISIDGAYLQNDPEIVVAPDGTLYAVWEDRRYGDLDIFVAKSSDNGATWSGFTRVNSPSKASQFEPHIAVDAAGGLYVIWQDARNNSAGTALLDVYFSTSTDGGITWSQDTQINNAPGSLRGGSRSNDRSAIDVAAYGTGEVYVVWADKSVDGTFIDYSADGGQTWQPTDKNLRDTQDSIAEFPTLDVDDNGFAHIVWQDGRSSSGTTIVRALYQAKIQGATNWFDPVPNTLVYTYSLPNGSPVGTYQPDITAWGDGRLCLVFEHVDPSVAARSAYSTNGGSSWSTPVALDPRNVNQDRVRLDSNADHTQFYAVWSDSSGSGQNVFSALSTNGCQSWTAKNSVNDDGTAATDPYPSVAYGQNGDILVAWVNDLDQDAIYISRSADQGANWTNSRLHQVVNGQTQTAPALAVEPDRSQSYALYRVQTTNTTADLHFTSSTNRWLAPTQGESIINDPYISGDRTNPDLVLGQPGYLYGVWQDSRNSLWEIFFDYSLDGGVTWTADRRINVESPGTHRNPDIAIANWDDLCVSWEDNRSGNFDIYVRCSLDGGVNWLVEHNVIVESGAASQVNPTLSLWGTDIYIAWQDAREGSPHIYMTHSPDFGQTWDANVRVDNSTGTVNNPSIAVDPGGNICIAWEDLRAADQDIYVGCSPDVGFSWSENNVIQESGTLVQSTPNIGYSGYWRLAWADERNQAGGDIYYAESADGQNWGNNILVIDQENDLGGLGAQSKPYLAVDNEGHSYLLWEDERSGYFTAYFSTPLIDGVALPDPLQVTASGLGQTAMATFEIVVPGDLPVTMNEVYVQVEHESGNYYNFPVVANLTINPGDPPYIYQYGRILEAIGVYTATAGYDNGSGFTPFLPEENNRVVFSLSMGAAALYQPTNQALVCVNPVNFSWSAVSGAAGYKLYQDAGAPANISTPAYSADLSDGSHNWYVKGYDILGTLGDASLTYAFALDTLAPTSPSLVSPENNATIPGNQPTLDFTDSTDAQNHLAGYEINLNGTIYTASQSDFTVPTHLSPGTYSWTVRAFDTCGHYSPLSETYTFIVTLATLDTPVLLQPPDGSAIYATQIDFTWQSVSGADGYYFQLDNGPVSTVYATSETRSGLTPGAHTWAVQAFNNQGDTSEWATGAFSILTEPVPAWVLMYYFSGDNNQMIATQTAINELESVANNAEASILVLWDQDGNGDSNVYEIVYDTDPDVIASLPLSVSWNPGELNMGDPQTLQNFVNWARQNYIASYYLLSVFDHGGGWAPNLPPELIANNRWGLGGAGLAWDLTNEDYLSTPEMGSALQAITSNGANKIDVLYYDACLMGMIENIYQVKDYAKYMVASENAMINTFPYNDYIPQITPATTPLQLSRAMVTAYGNTLPGTQGGTIAALDLSMADDTVSTIDTLAQAMLDENILQSQIRDHIFDTYIATQKLDYDEDGIEPLTDGYIDLHHFAQFVSSSSIFGADVKNAAIDVSDLLEEGAGLVIQEVHVNGSLYNLDNATSISIYAPLGEELYIGNGCQTPLPSFCDPNPNPSCIKMRDYYTSAAQINFVSNTMWDELINGLIDAEYCSLQASSILYPATLSTGGFPTTRPTSVLNTFRIGNLDPQYSWSLFLPMLQK